MIYSGQYGGQAYGGISFFRNARKIVAATVAFITTVAHNLPSFLSSRRDDRIVLKSKQ